MQDSQTIRMLPYSVLSVLVAISPVLAIPPPDFGFPEAPNHTELSLTYQNNGSPILVEEGGLFGVSIPSTQPTVALRTSTYESLASYTGPYVLIAADPDARYPSEPSLRWILHWLQTDLTAAPIAEDGTSQLVNSSEPRVPYMGPGPPSNSSAHRYIFYAFFQPDDFTIPAAFEGFNSTNRRSFNLTAFLDESNLGQTPAAAMYFFASNQTGVPQDFSAAAGGEFPGGNGDMITAGPGPSVTPTSTGASESTASPTTSGSEESSASATDSNVADRLVTGPGAMFAGLMAVLNLI